MIMEKTNYCKSTGWGREKEAMSIDTIFKEKKNCWEYMKCGCEVNGKNTREIGVCPAATERRVNGTNDGTNAGRACWAIVGTKCSVKNHGNCAQNNGSCSDCVFFSYVRIQQGNTFCNTEQIVEKIFLDL